MSEPVICFGQQPCGFFPNRFVFAKIRTALRLRSRIGGTIIFFLHDSDHDHRETKTVLTNRYTGKIVPLNFEVSNKTQKLHSPLYCKSIKREWHKKTLRRLPELVDAKWVELFASVDSENVTEFCLEMYRGMGLLDGIEIVRSSDPAIRNRAIDVDDYFVDTLYDGETVRARSRDGRLFLFKGGDQYFEVDRGEVSKSQISPARDTRLRWMQSVIRCTHYVAGEGEIRYLNTEETPEIEFVRRDPIDRSGEAYIDCEHDW